MEDAWIKLYREKNIELYNIENTLEEILNDNKVLQIALNMATNVLIGQMQKFYFNFNNKNKKFQLEDVNIATSYSKNKVIAYDRKIQINEEDEKELKLPNTVNRFVKIPKEVILANTLPEHRISALLYFNYNQTWENNVHYSPIYIIQLCRYKVNWHRGY